MLIMPATGLVLVQELVDYVIDFLHDDYRALKACACVCRSWSETSRFHLFDKIAVTRNQRLRQLQEFTFSLSLVRQLTLAVSASTILEFPHWSRFVQLRRLNLRVPIVDENLAEWLFGGFPLLGELTITSSKFDSLQTLMTVVHRFPYLRDLSISRCSWDSTGSPSLDSSSSKFPVRNLKLRLESNEFVDSLLQLHPDLDLWRFEIGGHYILVEYYFTRLLASCRNSLRLLNIRTLNASYLQTLDVSQLPSLQCVILPTYGAFTIPAHVLANITSEHIRDVIIHFSFHSRSEALQMEGDPYYCWQDLDDMMEKPQFRRATLNVALALLRDSSAPEYLDVARSRFAISLPKCAARGALEVDSTEVIHSRVLA